MFWKNLQLKIAVLFIITVDIHKLIGNCLIPLDPAYIFIQIYLIIGIPHFWASQESKNLPELYLF